ncbi:hypothetical protein MAR_032794 [Mya arenaria]|uniref:Guanylate-binding protein/Atlastin C-terminal domain-containing protein n=1 Tax=Mya arenaria TaxID=6604 RepID=A0ABY7GAA8_MYAAR|nr:hypothetical protein MAR_032794 [Mya arenaria]
MSVTYFKHSSMEYLCVKSKSENEEHITEYCENSLEALQSQSLLIDGIHNKSYAVVGGHMKFKCDLERVRQEYHLELKDKGYENRETATTWSTFMQTLAKPELEIIQLDNSLSEEEKKREREENKQEMQRMVHQIEEQNKQLLEEQSASYKDQQQETDKNERELLQQRILLLKEEDKERRKEERQWREDEQQRRDESENKRDEKLRQWREDEKERYKRAEEDLRTRMQNLQQKSDHKDEEANLMESLYGPRKEVGCGDTAMPVDFQLSVESSKKLAENCNHWQDLSIQIDKSREIEQRTRSQAGSSEWFDERRPRLTASKFGPIMTRKKSVNESFLRNTFFQEQFVSKPTTYELLNEKTAKVIARIRSFQTDNCYHRVHSGCQTENGSRRLRGEGQCACKRNKTDNVSHREHWGCQCASNGNYIEKDSQLNMRDND